MSLAAGARLDEILAPIGSGDMGDVYRARDTRIDASDPPRHYKLAQQHNAR